MVPHATIMCMTKTLYVMCGLPYSGKTTTAKQIATETGATMIAYDWIWARTMPKGSVPDLDNPIEMQKVFDIALGDIAIELGSGHSVVFDHINHTPQLRQQLKSLADSHNAEFKLIYLDTPKEELDRRRQENLTNHDRHHVESVNLQKTYGKWHPPTSEELVP